MNVTLVLTFVCYIIQLVASKENVLLLVPGSIAVLKEPYTILLSKGCNNFTCTVKPVEDTSPPQIEALITGFTHIVFADINNSFAASAEVVPSKYMDKTFVIFDFIPKVISSNLQIFMFKLEEVGFLAGVTAGLISTKKVVAVISGLPSVENKKHVNGFLQGVVYSCPLCKVQYQYSKSNTNYTLAIENAKVLNDAISYDVIHVAMQSGSFEVLNWAAKEKIYVIGANYDNLKSPSAFGQYLLLIDPIMEFYLNSIIKQYDVAISESLKNKEKNIISGFFELGSANGGVAVTENTSRTYSLFSNQTRQIEVVSNKVECTSSLLFTKKKFLFNTYTRLQNNSIEVGVNGSTGYLSGLARANDTFTVLHPFGDKAPPIWRNSFTLGTNNLMYVFGGLISGIESNTLYALDMNEYKWVKMETLSDVIPDARESHAAVYFENNLVIMGGMRGHQTFCDMWKFSTESKSWSEIKLDMKFCRGRFAYTLIDHLLYIFGGFDEAYAIRNDLATIDVLSGTVTLMKPLTDLKPPVLLDSMMIAFDSNVFVYGGSNLTDVTNQFYKFNIENNLWTLLNPRGDPPPVLAKGLMTKIDENRLMISGGISANSILQNSNFFFDIKNNIWKYGEISNLPSSLVSFSGFLYRQPENPCMWKENPNYSLWGYESEGVSDKLIKYQIGPQRPPLSSCRPGYYLAIDIYDEPVCTKCPEGSYNTNGNGICESCPHGGVCPGGSEVNVAVGFWQDANSSTSFPYIYKCPIDTCCSIAQGCNTTQQCKYGTTGALCSECSEAGHSLWVNECVNCTTFNIGYLVGLIGLSFLVVLLLTVIDFGMFFVNLVFCYQIIALLLKRDYSQSIIACLTSLDAEIMLNAISVNIDKCFAPFSGFEKSIFRLFLTFLPLLHYCIVIGVLKCLDKFSVFKKLTYTTQSYGRIIKKFLLIALLLVTPFSRSLISLYSCQQTKYDGSTQYLMMEFPDTTCWSGNHLIAIVIITLLLTLPAIVLFGLLMKLFYCKFSSFNSNNEVVAFLKIQYKDHCSYWILVEVIERVALASIAATYSYPEIDYAWGYFISIVVIIILQQNNVYRKNIENWSKLFLMLTMLGVAGIKLINGETDVTTDPTMQSLNQTSYNTHWKNFWLSAPLILAAFRIISDKLIRFFPKKKAVHLDIEKVK